MKQSGRWVLKFGRLYAWNLRRGRPRPSDQWHLDEMVVMIDGRRMYLWRAVDEEGEVLGGCGQALAQAYEEARLCAAPARNRQAALLSRAMAELSMTAQHLKACAEIIAQRTRTSQSRQHPPLSS